MSTHAAPTNTDTPPASSTTTSLQGLTIIMLTISLFMNVLCVYLLMGFSVPLQFLSEKNRGDDAIGIKRALLEVEYEKVGGKETYELLQKYSQMQIDSSIDNIKAAVNGSQPTAQAQTQADPSVTTADAPKEMSADEVKAIVSTASLEGNKDASIVVIEYSDMECPYCIRQYHSTKLFPTLSTQYGSKIALSFKNNRGVNHPGTEAKAIGALCARKVSGDGAYQKFYKGVMDKSTNEGGVMPVSDLPNLAKSLGVDMTKWQSCFDNKETLTQFTAETQEARKYDLGGTPGTLILNVKTGKYATVEGAYPYEKFVANIENLMK